VRARVSIVALVCVCTLAFGASVSSAAPVAARPVANATVSPFTGYLTIMFGRSQWVQTDANCDDLPNTVPLDQIGAAMHAQGLTATGTVVADRTLETDMQCLNGFILYPSWDELAALRDTDGWTFISGGATYANMTNLTPDQQQAESCGSLTALTDHGNTSGWGMFGYPNNKFTTAIQTNVVSHCFAFGRTYAGGRNLRSTMVAPYLQRTNSVNGGACNNSALACYDPAPLGGRRYRSPVNLAGLMKPRADQWDVIQFYRMVTGSYSSPNGSWDCTSADWHDHWTNKPELYCWNDFLFATGGIPSSVHVTDPATVATAWGIPNPNAP
jgi:hypothetical protein